MTSIGCMQRSIAISISAWKRCGERSSDPTTNDTRSMASPSRANACADPRARGADDPIVEPVFDPCQLSDNRLEKLTIGSCNPGAALRTFGVERRMGWVDPCGASFGTARRTSPQVRISGNYEPCAETCEIGGTASTV